MQWSFWTRLGFWTQDLLGVMGPSGCDEDSGPNYLLFNTRDDHERISLPSEDLRWTFTLFAWLNSSCFWNRVYWAHKILIIRLPTFKLSGFGLGKEKGTECCKKSYSVLGCKMTLKYRWLKVEEQMWGGGIHLKLSGEDFREEWWHSSLLWNLEGLSCGRIQVSSPRDNVRGNLTFYWKTLKYIACETRHHHPSKSTIKLAHFPGESADGCQSADGKFGGKECHWSLKFVLTNERAAE